ncbi:MAG: helix-turn-helix transcriptional regulator [Clostridiaceae bacterium]
MFGDNLKKWRKERKLTQAELAESVGVSGAYIQQLELGKKTNPSLEVVLKICSALQIAPFDLEFEYDDEDMYKYLMNKSMQNSLDVLQKELKEGIEIINIAVDFLISLGLSRDDLENLYPSEIEEIINFLKISAKAKLEEIKARNEERPKE